MFGKKTQPVAPDAIFAMPATVEMLDRRSNPEQVAYVRKEHYDEAVRALRSLDRTDVVAVETVLLRAEKIDASG